MAYLEIVSSELEDGLPRVTGFCEQDKLYLSNEVSVLSAIAVGNAVGFSFGDDGTYTAYIAGTDVWMHRALNEGQYDKLHTQAHLIEAAVREYEAEHGQYHLSISEYVGLLDTEAATQMLGWRHSAAVNLDSEVLNQRRLAA